MWTTSIYSSPVQSLILFRFVCLTLVNYTFMMFIRWSFGPLFSIVIVVSPVIRVLQFLLSLDFMILDFSVWSCTLQSCHWHSRICIYCFSFSLTPWNLFHDGVCLFLNKSIYSLQYQYSKVLLSSFLEYILHLACIWFRHISTKLLLLEFLCQQSSHEH